MDEKTQEYTQLYEKNRVEVLMIWALDASSKH